MPVGDVPYLPICSASRVRVRLLRGGLAFGLRDPRIPGNLGGCGPRVRRPFEHWIVEPKVTSVQTAEQNKQNGKAFYDLMFNQCRPAEAIERYAGDGLPPAQPARRRRQGGVHRLLRAHGARSTRASASSSCGPSPRATTSCCTATRLARRPRLGGHRHLPARRGRQGRRALGRAAGRPRARRPTTTACSEGPEPAGLPLLLDEGTR